jgi:hypothetical protein
MSTFGAKSFFEDFRKKHCIGDPFDTYRFSKLPAQLRVPGDGNTVGIWAASAPSEFDGIGGEPQLRRHVWIALGEKSSAFR